jgi:hypothetical protein
MVFSLIINMACVLALTGQQKGVRKGGEASHEDRPKDRMEALRLAKTEICVSKPYLNHQPCDACDGPGAIS